MEDGKTFSYTQNHAGKRQSSLSTFLVIMNNNNVSLSNVNGSGNGTEDDSGGDGGGGILHALENLDMSVPEWVALLVGVVALWVVLSFCLGYFLGPNYHTCYLCEKQIPRRCVYRIKVFKFLTRPQNTFRRMN